MSKEIIVTPELLEQRSNECKSYARDVDEILKKLRSLVKALETEWKGKSSEKFFSQINGTVFPSFEKIRSLLDSMASFLKIIAFKGAILPDFRLPILDIEESEKTEEMSELETRVVTPELLEQRSKECKSYARDVDAILKELRNLAKALEVECKSRDVEDFLYQFEDIVPQSFGEARNLLVDASYQLKWKAEDFKRLIGEIYELSRDSKFIE